MNKVGNKAKESGHKGSSGVKRSMGDFMRPRYPDQPSIPSQRTPKNTVSGLGDLVAIILTGNKDGLPLFIGFLLDLVGLLFMLISLVLVIAAAIDLLQDVLTFIAGIVLILMVINKPNLFK